MSVPVSIALPNAAFSVALSPDSKTLAVGCFDGAIRLYDPVSHTPKGELRGHRMEVRAVAFSPDGRTLASAGGNYREHEQPGELKLWDVAEGRVRHELRGHTAMVWSVAFSPDGVALASGSWDNTARLWDVRTGRLRAVLKGGHHDAVRFVAFAPVQLDGPPGGAPSVRTATLATAGFDGQLRFWRNSPGEEEDGKLFGYAAIPGVTGLSCIAFAPDGKTLAISPRPSGEGTPDDVILFDLTTWHVRARLKGHPHAVLTLAYSPDGKTLASGGGVYAESGNNGEVIVWDAASGREKARSDGLKFWVESVAFTPDGKALVSGGGVNDVGGEIRVWSPQPAASWGPRVHLNSLRGQRIWSLAYSPNGRTLAVGSGLHESGVEGFGNDRGALNLWGLGPGVMSEPLTESRYIRAVAFSPDGKTLATAELDGTAKLRDAGTGKVIRVFEGHDAGVNGVAFSPDGKSLATAGLDSTVRTWDVETGRQTRTFPGHEGPVYSVAYRPDGQTLASCGDDDTVRLWDVASGLLKSVLGGHENDVEAVAFSPDGKILASASWDRTVRLWDAESGRGLATLSGHNEPVLGLAFSPDGKTLVTSGGTWGSLEPGPGKGELKVWDVATRSLTLTLDGHNERVFAVAFSPDGKTLASASWDGIVLLWDLGEKSAELPKALGPRIPPGRTGHRPDTPGSLPTSDVRPRLDAGQGPSTSSP